MKRSSLLMLLLVLSASVTFSADAGSSRLITRASLNAPAITATPLLTVPAETEATVQLLSGIHSRMNHVGDAVAGRLVQPVYVDGRLALPSGTLVYGEITRVRPAGRLHRAAELGLRFDQVSLPDNQMEPITAELASVELPGPLQLDREGYLKGGRRFSWKEIAGGLVGMGGLAGLGIKVAGTTAAGALAPLSAAGFLGYEVFWPRGREVHVPPDTRCRIRLDYPLTVRGQS